MAEPSKFGKMPGAAPGAGGLRCEEWESLLVDMLDGVLPPADAAAFRTHSLSCASCGELLEHARQGQEWLEFLHKEPEIPARLVGKILDKTVGVGAVPLPVVAAAQGTGPMAMVVPVRRSFHETRLMMTVAMAFFSIAVTLNIVGVKVTNLRMADLRPSAIGGALSRQFYGARGQVVRYYENLRFVYQLESRMRELRQDTETPAPAHQAQPQKKTEPSTPGGTGNKDNNGDRNNGGNKDGRKDGSLKTQPERGAVLAAHRPETELNTAEAVKKTERTEVRVSETTGSPISLDQCQAGPRQIFQAASYDGRSLA
jgi:hypothetical protein